MAIVDLATKEAELVKAKAALAAARLAVQYTQGDKQVARATVETLRTDVAALAREVRELTAAAAGSAAPLVLTPKWD